VGTPYQIMTLKYFKNKLIVITIDLFWFVINKSIRTKTSIIGVTLTVQQILFKL